MSHWAHQALDTHLHTSRFTFHPSHLTLQEAPRFPQKMSELARDFILRALEKEPSQRPSIVDMIK